MSLQILKVGTWVKVISGPHEGHVSYIQDILGQRTYILTNNIIVDFWQIVVIKNESETKQTLAEQN